MAEQYKKDVIEFDHQIQILNEAFGNVSQLLGSACTVDANHPLFAIATNETMEMLEMGDTIQRLRICAGAMIGLVEHPIFEKWDELKPLKKAKIFYEMAQNLLSQSNVVDPNNSKNPVKEKGG